MVARSPPLVRFLPRVLATDEHEKKLKSTTAAGKTEFNQKLDPEFWIPLVFLATNKNTNEQRRRPITSEIIGRR